MRNYSKIYNAMYYCIHNKCDKCPYKDKPTGHYTCHDRLMKDTLELLDKVGELLNHCYSDTEYDTECIDSVYDQL